MTELTATQLSKYAFQMLHDYDSNTPGTIFKDKIRIIPFRTKQFTNNQYKNFMETLKLDL